jgi:hypothetical protein
MGLKIRGSTRLRAAAESCFTTNQYFDAGGTYVAPARSADWWEGKMNGIVYLIGLVVVVLAILSFFGLH